MDVLIRVNKRRRWGFEGDYGLMIGCYYGKVSGYVSSVELHFVIPRIDSVTE